jgi:hypothetical protein
MVKKRWRMKKPMLVPAQWNGSVQHFYHFFFGYFMPVVLHQQRTGILDFVVRDCGPMNPWFSLLDPGTTIEYVPAGVMLQRVLTHRQEHTILRGWDDPTRFHRRSMRKFSDTILERAQCSRGLTASFDRPRILLLERRATPDFYLSADSEVLSSGSAYRSLPNVSALPQALSSLGDVSVIDSASLTPEQQVTLFASTDLLVAQHGAGLSNMVFMPTGSSVVEIKPPLDPTVDSIYSNLASSATLGHVSVMQTHDHAEIDPAAVVSAASMLLASPNTLVPRMTGSLPIRILRQLPRRA